MPPIVALFLCIFFIILILIIDSKRNSKQSIVLWIPMFWILISASRSISLWLNPNTTVENIDLFTGSPIDRTIFSIFMFIGIIILFKRNIHLEELIYSNKELFILFIYIGLSILWSNYKGLAFKRWMRSLGDIIMILVILTEKEPDKALISVLKRIGYILIPLSIVFIKYYLFLGVSYTDEGYPMWIGVTTHKNQLGQLVYISAIIFFWELLRTNNKLLKYINLFMFFISIWLLTGNPTVTSQTSTIIFILSIIIFTLISLLRNSLEYIKVNIFLILLILVISIYLGFIEIIVDLSGRDMTFTGRTILWTELIKIGAKHPFEGVGYGSFWLEGLAHNLWNIPGLGWKPSSAHNGYIGVYLHLGIIGLFLLFLLIKSSFNKITHGLFIDIKTAKFKMVLLIAIIIYNTTESSFTKAQSFIWLIFLLITIDIPQKK